MPLFGPLPIQTRYRSHAEVYPRVYGATLAALCQKSTTRTTFRNGRPPSNATRCARPGSYGSSEGEAFDAVLLNRKQLSQLIDCFRITIREECFRVLSKGHKKGHNLHKGCVFQVSKWLKQAHVTGEF